MIAEYFRTLPAAYTAVGSHLPTLGRALDLTHGPVLELGMGDCSTAQLHEACNMQGRLLWSYDHDAVWASRYTKLATKRHVVEAVKDYGDVPVYARLWAVVLVDHAPGGRRNEEIKRLQEQAMLIVCHDSEPKHAKCYQYESVFSAFRFRYDDQPAELPWTTVISNYIDVARYL